MYLCVRSWLGRPAALIAAVAYTYAPYHLLNLYVRANLAESVAFVWLPLCLWTARQAVLRPSWRWVAGLAASYAGLMLSLGALFAILYGLTPDEKWDARHNPGQAWPDSGTDARMSEEIAANV